MSDGAAKRIFGGLKGTAKGMAPAAPLPRRPTLGVRCMRCASDPHVNPIPEAVKREGGKPLCAACLDEIHALGGGSWGAGTTRRRSADPTGPWGGR